MMLTFWTVRQALLFDLKWSICCVIQRLLRKTDNTGNFYKPAVGLISSTRVHDCCGKICGLCTSFVLASGLINISHSVKQTHQSPREKEKCASLGIILGFHAFILVFYFHLVNFWFLGKLNTGRPWPTPWPTPWPRPWPTPGFVPTLFLVFSPIQSVEWCERQRARKVTLFRHILQNWAAELF